VGDKKGVAIVEWEASPAGDVIADALIALLMHAQSSAASIRLTSKPCRHPRSSDDSSSDDEEPSAKKAKAESEILTESRLKLIKDTLKDQFESVEAVYEGNVGTYEITTDCGLESGTSNEEGVLTCDVKVSFEDGTGSGAEISVECVDQKLASNVRECLRNLAQTFVPVKSL
jgi:hypothetical protein